MSGYRNGNREACREIKEAIKEEKEALDDLDCE